MLYDIIMILSNKKNFVGTMCVSSVVGTMVITVK